MTNMKKLKISILLCLLFAMISLTACGIFPENFFSNDKTVADETIAEIEKHINDTDVDSLTQMFSKKALRTVDNLDDKLKEFVAKLSSGINSYELYAGPAGYGFSDHGDFIKSIDVSYKIKTNDNNLYYIGFKNVYVNTIDEDMVGLSSLRLSKNDDAVWDKDNGDCYIMS